MLWAVVMIAVLTTILATTALTMLQANDRDDVVDAATKLRSLAAAVKSFNAVVNQGGGGGGATRFYTPRLLRMLTRSVRSADSSGCQAAANAQNLYNANSVTVWGANGPFGVYMVDSLNGGLMSAIGRINDTISTDSTTFGKRRTAVTSPYFIQIRDVPIAVARLLDMYVDGQAGNMRDTIYYQLNASPTTDSLTLVSWKVLGLAASSC